MDPLSTADDKWLDALAAYWGGGIAPYFKQSDGTVDAAKTIDDFCAAHGISKSGKNGGASEPG